MKKQFCLTIAVLLTAVTLIFYVNASLARPRVPQAERHNIRLKFTPMPVSELETVVFESDWELLDTRVVNNVAGVDQVLVSFCRLDEGRVALILQDRFGFYDLKMELEEGEPDRVAVTAMDLNGNGANELLLTADSGATIKEARVYTYDGDSWLCLLATENLIIADISNDGRDELITTSMGSLPGYVWIYRWTGSNFEKSDVNEGTENIYAALVTVDGRTLIETGKANEPQYYLYTEGILVEVDPN